MDFSGPNVDISSQSFHSGQSLPNVQPFEQGGIHNVGAGPIHSVQSLDTVSSHSPHSVNLQLPSWSEPTSPRIYSPPANRFMNWDTLMMSPSVNNMMHSSISSTLMGPGIPQESVKVIEDPAMTGREKGNQHKDTVQKNIVPNGIQSGDILPISPGHEMPTDIGQDTSSPSVRPIDIGQNTSPFNVEPMNFWQTVPQEHVKTIGERHSISLPNIEPIGQDISQQSVKPNNLGQVVAPQGIHALDLGQRILPQNIKPLDLGPSISFQTIHQISPDHGIHTPLVDPVTGETVNTIDANSADLMGPGNQIHGIGKKSESIQSMFKNIHQHHGSKLGSIPSKRVSILPVPTDITSEKDNMFQQNPDVSFVDPVTGKISNHVKTSGVDVWEPERQIHNIGTMNEEMQGMPTDIKHSFRGVSSSSWIAADTPSKRVSILPVPGGPHIVIPDNVPATLASDVKQTSGPQFANILPDAINTDTIDNIDPRLLSPKNSNHAELIDFLITQDMTQGLPENLASPTGIHQDHRVIPNIQDPIINLNSAKTSTDLPVSLEILPAGRMAHNVLDEVPKMSLKKQQRRILKKQQKLEKQQRKLEQRQMNRSLRDHKRAERKQLRQGVKQQRKAVRKVMRQERKHRMFSEKLALRKQRRRERLQAKIEKHVKKLEALDNTEGIKPLQTPNEGKVGQKNLNVKTNIIQTNQPQVLTSTTINTRQVAEKGQRKARKLKGKPKAKKKQQTGWTEKAQTQRQ